MPVLVDDDLRLDGDDGRRPSLAVNRRCGSCRSAARPHPARGPRTPGVLRDRCVRRPRGPEVRARRVRGSPGRGTGASEVRRDDVKSARKHFVVLLPVGRCRGVRQRGAVQLRAGAGLYGDVRRDAQVNLARRRVPKRHVTIRYLEPDFADLHIGALGGLSPDGMPDGGYPGPGTGPQRRQLVLASGLRRQEFSYLLVYQIPPPPSSPGRLPVPFPVPAGVTKDRRYRTTWADHASLEAVHHYAALDRAAAAGWSPWQPPPRWGVPLMVTEPDAVGGRVNGGGSVGQARDSKHAAADSGSS